MITPSPDARKGFIVYRPCVASGATQTFFVVRGGNHPAPRRHHIHRRFAMRLLMKPIFAICLAALAGCAAGTSGREQLQPIDTPQVQYVDGSLQASASPLKSAPVITRADIAGGRAPCQTNDPMPVARRGKAQVAPIPSATTRPSVVPMPNACPVTVPWTATTVVTKAPLKREQQEPAAPSEPRR